MRRSVAALMVTVFCGGLLAAPARADHSWGGYHWARTANPFTLKLGDNVSGLWDPYLRTTSSDWSASSVLDTVVVTGATTPRKCRPASGRVEVCNATFGNNGWLGIASIAISGAHITAGTVKLNDTYFSTARYNTPAWRNLVMCQEVGHTLGLDHQDEDFANPSLGTCMDYSSDPAPNQHPNAHDYEQLGLVYEHLDSSTTVSASTANGQIGSDTPASWGRLVSGSRRSGHSEYVIDLGFGNSVITIVTWAT